MFIVRMRKKKKTSQSFHNLETKTRDHGKSDLELEVQAILELTNLMNDVRSIIIGISAHFQQEIAMIIGIQNLIALHIC